MQFFRTLKNINGFINVGAKYAENTGFQVLFIGIACIGNILYELCCLKNAREGNGSVGNGVSHFIYMSY